MLSYEKWSKEVSNKPEIGLTELFKLIWTSKGKIISAGCFCAILASIGILAKPAEWRQLVTIKITAEQLPTDLRSMSHFSGIPLLPYYPKDTGTHLIDDMLNFLIENSVELSVKEVAKSQHSKTKFSVEITSPEWNDLSGTINEYLEARIENYKNNKKIELKIYRKENLDLFALEAEVVSKLLTERSFSDANADLENERIARIAKAIEILEEREHLTDSISSPISTFIAPPFIVRSDKKVITAILIIAGVTGMLFSTLFVTGMYLKQHNQLFT